MRSFEQELQTIIRVLPFNSSQTMFDVFVKVAKLLETNRSRAIGIKMSSLNCQLEDIRNAVYNMDTSVVDMERYSEMKLLMF